MITHTLPQDKLPEGYALRLTEHGPIHGVTLTDGNGDEVRQWTVLRDPENLPVAEYSLGLRMVYHQAVAEAHNDLAKFYGEAREAINAAKAAGERCAALDTETLCLDCNDWRRDFHEPVAPSRGGST